MRLPLPLAWTLLVITFFTAGLLRRFHDRIPESPAVHPLVGSLLFGVIFFILLVSAREWRRGPVPGPGIRLGSLTPLLLMLFVEKWFSLMVYPIVFSFIENRALEDALLDAQFRTMAGVGLIVVCLLVAPFSRPTMRKTFRRARLMRWPTAAIGGLLVVAATMTLVALLSSLLGGTLRLRMPEASPALGWVLGGQFLLAFSEEFYYRGLLLCEVERLAPRLGLRNRAARRWFALLATALLFGFEHLSLEPPWNVALRELVFAVSLGILFGILVMVTANIHYAAAIHAWINWLLLGAVPYFADAQGRAALPPGTYIGLTLIFAFMLAFFQQQWKRRRRQRESEDVLEL